MSKRKRQPETSVEAYKALTPEKLRTDYELILMALRRLGEANYNQIANELNISELNTISRRTLEMQKLGLIYRTGRKSLTDRNRNAFNYALVTNGQKSPEPVKSLLGKSVGEIAKEILAPIQLSILDQNNT